MLLLYVLISLLLGFSLGVVVGVVALAWYQAALDEESISIGFIKLRGRYFSLTEIDV